MNKKNTAKKVSVSKQQNQIRIEAYDSARKAGLVTLTLEERVEALEKKMAALEQAGQPEIKSSEEIRMTFSQAEALGVLKP